MNMLSFQRISRRCFGHTIFLGLKHGRRINFLHGQWGGYTLKWWVSQLMSIGIMMLGRVMKKTHHHQPVRLYSLFIPNQVQHKVALRHHVRTKCLKQSIGFQSSVSVSAGQGESSDSLAESSPVEIHHFLVSLGFQHVPAVQLYHPHHPHLEPPALDGPAACAWSHGFLLDFSPQMWRCSGRQLFNQVGDEPKQQVSLAGDLERRVTHPSILYYNGSAVSMVIPPQQIWCKLQGIEFDSKLWAYPLPKVKVCRLLGKVTPARLFLKLSPNVRVWRAPGKVKPCKLWLNQKPNNSPKAVWQRQACQTLIEPQPKCQSLQAAWQAHTCQSLIKSVTKGQSLKATWQCQAGQTLIELLPKGQKSAGCFARSHLPNSH